MSCPLAIKLCELEEHIGRLQSHLQVSESENDQKVRAEAEALRQEYVENERLLQGKLRHSRPEIVQILFSAYQSMESIIQRARQAIEEKSLKPGSEERSLENKLLLAEYELDFSMLAIDRALMVSLDAIAAQLAFLKEEKG